jgi:hypothetical protein
MDRGWFDTGPKPPCPPAIEEPTQQLPVLKPPAPPRIGARVVMVHERRSLGLLVLTGILVALTVGVILGQTVAYPGRSASTAAAQVVPADTGYSTPPTVPPSAVPTPSAQPLPVSGQRVSAPLGAARAQTFEVYGAATLVSLVSADLGDRLYDVAALDDSAVPKVTPTASGPVLEFVRTGAAGRVGATVQLNSRVRWKLRVIGAATEQDIDMHAGQVTGIELAGGAARTVLRLPKPRGTVAVRISAPVRATASRASGATTALDVVTASGVPVRLKLTNGADTAVVEGRTRTNVKPATLTPAGWTNAANRYDHTAAALISTLHVTHG